MAISKDSRRVQITLNSSKDKEKEIMKFLDSCMSPSVAIKEIIFNHIVTHRDTKLPQVTQSKVTENYSKSLQVSNFNSDVVRGSDDKLVEVSNCEENSELELNELEELKNFI